MVDEKDLVTRIVQGVPGAEGEFIRFFRPRLLRCSKGFLGDQNAECEDMVQDTFLVALPRLKNRDLGAPVFPWLRLVCLRLCYARRRGRDGVLICLDDELNTYMRRMDVEQVRTANAEVQIQQKKELLREVIKQLAPAERQIIQLRNVHGMNYAQIGQVLDLSPTAIAERLAEARGHIRRFVYSELAA
jgi:RNA polymerase sigma-70 factor (ECF subfamily)